MPAHACDCVLLSMHVYLPVGHNHGSATSVSEERETIQKVSQESRRKKPYASGWVGGWVVVCVCVCVTVLLLEPRIMGNCCDQGA